MPIVEPHTFTGLIHTVAEPSKFATFYKRGTIPQRLIAEFPPGTGADLPLIPPHLPATTSVRLKFATSFSVYCQLTFTLQPTTPQSHYFNRANSYHDMSSVTVVKAPLPSTNPTPTTTTIGPFSGQIPARKPAPINPLAQTCHSCGADLSHSHIAQDAQRRISELEAQVKILTTKATAAGEWTRSNNCPNRSKYLRRS